MIEMKADTRISLDDKRYFHRSTVTDATSEAVRIPSVGREARVTVAPGTDAKVQSTGSSYSSIEDGTAIWEDWPSGTVNIQTSDGAAASTSALRLISTGSSTWEITV